MAENNNPTNNNVSLPPYNHANPKSWLKLLAMAFTAYNVTAENQKIYLTIAALPVTQQSEASEFVAKENNNTFNALEKFIIESNAIPTQKRIQQLLTNTPIGDRKPTQYLRHLRELAGPETEENSPIIRSIFLQGLPNHITMIIAPKSDQPLDEIAEFADRIFSHMDSHSIFKQTNTSFHSSNTNTHNINEQLANINASFTSYKDDTKNKHTSLEQSITNLQQQMSMLSTNITTSLSNLQRQLDNLQREQQQQRRSRSTSRNNNNSASNSNTEGLCYYHLRFKDKATKCTQPCSYNQKN